LQHYSASADTGLYYNTEYILRKVRRFTAHSVPPAT
jgi:hypothetical protein